MRLIAMFLFVAALSLGLVFTDTASAQKGAKKTANHLMIEQLEGIRATLNKANHDYKGHRAAAVHQITHAIHLAKHGVPHPKPGEHFTPAKGGNNEPQSVSDAQLQAAMKSLQALTVPPVKHQTKIQEHVTKAISDLQTALKVI